MAGLIFNGSVGLIGSIIVAFLGAMLCWRSSVRLAAGGSKPDFLDLGREALPGRSYLICTVTQPPCGALM